MSPTDPSPRRGVRTGRLLAPSQRSRASLRRAAAPRQTRARPRDTPPPPPRAPRPSAPTPTRHPSAPAAPHPSRRRAPAHPAPCQPDAAQSRRLRNPAGTPPRPCPPPQRPSAPTRPLAETPPHCHRQPRGWNPAGRDPHRGLRRSWRAHTRCSPGPPPALRAARSRLLQPGTRRDIRARIPTPGLFLGDRPRPDRNSFLSARVRTSSTALSVPPPSSPLPPFPWFPLSSLP